MPNSGHPLKSATAVAISWHGVLFDRDRRAIHDAARATFARWGVEVTDDELLATRGPTGRAHLERLFSIPRIAEAFRERHRHWANADDLEAMERDIEPRLLAAAASAPEPNADACSALRRLHEQGKRTAVICCTSRRLLQPQLDALQRAGVPIDCLVTADEACEPAPAPWGIFEVLQQLGIKRPSDLVYIDDSPLGPIAAHNAGARSVAFAPSGTAQSHADAVLRSLGEVGERA